MDIPYMHQLSGSDEKRNFMRMDYLSYVHPFDEASYHPEEGEPEKTLGSTLWALGDPALCGMMVYDYEVRFDGALLDAAGVGDVCSMPEARGHGYVSQMFRDMLARWYDDGRAFSLLYPFSADFYRRYGYEMIKPAYYYTIPLTSLLSFPRPQEVHPSADITELSPIADEFGRSFNLSIRRKENQWGFLQGDPYLKYAKDVSPQLCLTYVLDGDSYVCFCRGAFGADGAADLIVKDFAYTTRDGLKKILGFLSQFSSQLRSVRIILPLSIPLLNLLPDPSAAKAELFFDGMGRIVNVSQVLRQMKYPRSEGRFTVKVTDPVLPQNEDVFTVSYTKERAVNVLRSHPEEWKQSRIFLRERAAREKREAEEAEKNKAQLEQRRREEALRRKQENAFTSSAVGFQEEAQLKKLDENGGQIDLAMSADTFTAPLGFLEQISVPPVKITEETPAKAETPGMEETAPGEEETVPGETPKPEEETLTQASAPEAETADAGLKAADEADAAFSEETGPEAAPKKAGRAHVSATKDLSQQMSLYGSPEPDLTCSIGTLTQLVTGVISLEEALYRPDVKCTREEALREIFVKKNVFYSDHF